MENIIQLASWLVTDGPHLLSAVVSVLSALIALFMLIPGEQPEKFLQGVVDWVSKYSRK